MTMTPWNLTHGQWSKNLTMATDILESAPWSMVKMVILWLNFVVKSGGDKALTMTMTPWSLPHGQWSNMAFLDQICGKNLGRPF